MSDNTELAAALEYAAEPMLLNTPARTLLLDSAAQLRRDEQIFGYILALVAGR